MEQREQKNQEISVAPPSGKRVFISYSHEPKENAAFVRNLAGRLTIAGFSVWLDEEQITGGDTFEDEILAAARASEAAIFVVTDRWAKRPWTRHEVQLFGERSERGDGVRLVVLTREEIDYGHLGPYLSRLHRIDWFPDEGEPDARMWQIYCSIQKRGPGRRDQWGDMGRALTVGVAPERPPSPQAVVSPVVMSSAAKRSDAHALPFEGRPVDLVAGDEQAFVVSDLDEWLAIGPDGPGAPLPRLSPAIASLGDGSHGLIVAICDPMVAQLTTGGWNYRPLPSPALALCAGSDGLYAGTTTGSVVRLQASRTEQLCQLREPVIALAAVDDALLALGAQGLLGSVALARGRRGEVRWLESDGIGRPVGFFPAEDGDRIGLVGITGFGVIDPVSGQVTVCSTKWEQGIQDVIFLGPQRWPYAVLTDDGQLLFVSSALDRVKAAPLPPGAVVVGCCGTPGQSLAVAWTREGRLYRILSADRSAECLVEGGVVLAASMPGCSLIAAIQWDEAQGASMTMLSP